MFRVVNSPILAQKNMSPETLSSVIMIGACWVPYHYLNKCRININIAQSEIFNGNQKSFFFHKMSNRCRMSVKPSVRAWPLDSCHTQRANKAERLSMAWYNPAILLKLSSARSLPVWSCENRDRCHSLPVPFMAKRGSIQSCSKVGWILYCTEKLSQTSRVSHKTLLSGSSQQSAWIAKEPFQTLPRWSLGMETLAIYW